MTREVFLYYFIFIKSKHKMDTKKVVASYCRYKGDTKLRKVSPIGLILENFGGLLGTNLMQLLVGL